jgi:hypothetical protein
MLMLKDNQIGGAIVRRVFSSGGKQVTPGTKLSRDEVLLMPAGNRYALVNKKYIDIFPAGGDDVSMGVKPDRFVISLGFSQFHVIEGKRLTDKPISREQAYALAGQPMPEGKPSAARRRKKQPQPETVPSA